MTVSDKELEKAIRSVARLIDRYGDYYWPIFERLETELRVRNDRKKRVNSYLVCNKENADDSDMHSA
ncbi:MAG: hypothetical protein B7X55_12340 [Rhodobacterales bacterium 34-62-10]|nr:MAG: hypothetical protein B7X55_12340 [Rhodobacterales bacterium 34-62-10]